jgi:hypothetical protein
LHAIATDGTFFGYATGAMTCGEGGERTLWLSAIIFNALGSTDWLGAPNFPPHDLGEFGGTKIPRFCDFYHYSKQKD